VKAAPGSVHRMEHTTHSVTSADGTAIVYHTQGTGTPLIIVPGTLTTAENYRPLADLLALHYRVILMERRDYGVSGNGEHPAEFAAQAADLNAVLDAAAEPGFVFGHSCGGIVTLHALGDSAKIRRLALYEPPVSLLGPTLAPTLATVRDQVSAGRPADAVAEFFTAIRDSAPPAGMLADLAALLGPLAHGMVADLECITGMDPDLGPYSTLDLPTLLLTGEHTDAYGSRSIELLQQTLPHTHTITFPDAGHQIDDPRPVAETLRENSSSLSSSPDKRRGSQGGDRGVSGFSWAEQ
jgi:pimeloyl-ACP methyl ester carboxylesterase